MAKINIIIKTINRLIYLLEYNINAIIVVISVCPEGIPKHSNSLLFLHFSNGLLLLPKYN
jgi:hypothetical protein